MPPVTRHEDHLASCSNGAGFGSEVVSIMFCTKFLNSGPQKGLNVDSVVYPWPYHGSLLRHGALPFLGLAGLRIFASGLKALGFKQSRPGS